MCIFIYKKIDYSDSSSLKTYNNYNKQKNLYKTFVFYNHGHFCSIFLKVINILVAF